MHRIFPHKNVSEMKRFAYNTLNEWKIAKDRKPLIVYGARQAGKTYIVKEFGEQEFDNMIYVNCYKNGP